MSRYTHDGNWTIDDDSHAPFVVQSATCIDTLNGDRWPDRARRVIDTRTGKPAKRGEGGTVPFYGEMAWADARRLAGDLYWAERSLINAAERP